MFKQLEPGFMSRIFKEREAKLGSELAEKEVKLQEYKERLGEYTQHNLELMSDLSDAQTRIKVWKHSAEEKERKLDAIRNLLTSGFLEKSCANQIRAALKTSIDNQEKR